MLMFKDWDMVVAQFLAGSCSLCFSLNSLINSRSYTHIRKCGGQGQYTCVRVHLIQSLDLFPHCK